MSSFRHIRTLSKNLNASNTKIMLLKNSNIKYNDTFLLAVFYSIMHGGILLIPNAIFWDDWVLYRTDPSVISNTFKQAGVILNWVSYLHITLLEIGPWSYKFLTFLLMFISGLLLNLILLRAAILSKEDRFLVVLLYLVLPFNMARVAIIDFPYTLCLFSFFLAWHFIERYRILALVLFFFSFNTNSLLVFYALPMMDIMYRNGYLKNSRSLINFVLKHLDFLILPFLFFLIKINLFAPTGNYANYNQHFSVNNIQNAVKSQFKDLSNLRINPVLTLLLFPIIYFATRKLINNAPLQNQKYTLLVFSIGCVAGILGGMPYWILGHVPTFIEWTSRHQLLLPLGVALTTVAIAQIFGTQFKKFFITAILSISLSFGVLTYLAFIADWKKQTAIIEYLTKNKIIGQSNLVIFDDHTTSINGMDRTYRFYEWNGILELVTGNEDIFGISPKELSQYRQGQLDQYFQSEFKAGSHIRNDSLPQITIQISFKTPKKNFASFFPRYFDELQFKTLYKENKH